jgi:hypothetical protein
VKTAGFTRDRNGNWSRCGNSQGSLLPAALSGQTPFFCLHLSAFLPSVPSVVNPPLLPLHLPVLRVSALKFLPLPGFSSNQKSKIKNQKFHHFLFHSAIAQPAHPAFFNSSSVRSNRFRQFVTSVKLIPSLAAISRRFTTPARRHPNSFSTA